VPHLRKRLRNNQQLRSSLPGPRQLLHGMWKLLKSARPYMRRGRRRIGLKLGILDSLQPGCFHRCHRMRLHRHIPFCFPAMCRLVSTPTFPGRPSLTAIKASAGQTRHGYWIKITPYPPLSRTCMTSARWRGPFSVTSPRRIQNSPAPPPVPCLLRLLAADLTPTVLSRLPLWPLRSLFPF
jgi:hypothetical protein